MKNRLVLLVLLAFGMASPFALAQQRDASMGDCRGTFYELSDYGCCDGHIFELGAQGCCSGTVYNLAFQGCCSNQVYNTTISMCINGIIVPRPPDAGGDDGDNWSSSSGNPCNPDRSPPRMFGVGPDIIITNECPEPPLPDVRAWDLCCGSTPVTLTEYSFGNPCSTTIERTWTATDCHNLTRTVMRTFVVKDTLDPVIDIPSEIKVEVDITGYAALPDYTYIPWDQCDLKVVTQNPAPGGLYKVGERLPVTLYAEDECGRTKSVTFTVIFVCGACRSCSSSGSCSPGNHSVDLDFSLGLLKNGRSAGKLSLYARQPHPRLFTPSALRYIIPAVDGASVIRSPDGALRQLSSAQTLADIVTIDPLSYEIRFYPPNAWGSPDDQGLYSPTGNPAVVWRLIGSQGNSNYLGVAKIQGGSTNSYTYLYSPENLGWTLNSCGGLKVETRFSVWDAQKTTRTETYSVTKGWRALNFREVNEYRQFPWGEARVKTIQDPDGAALTTTRGYYEDPLQPSRYARLAWERQPNGGFAWYDYDAEGRVVAEAEAWKDVDIPILESNAVVANAKVTLSSFAPVDSADDGTARPRNPRTITQMAAGTIVAKTYYAYIVGPKGEVSEIKEECSSPTATYGDAGNRRTRTVYYSDNEALWPGEIKSTEYPDGRLDRHLYERGSYSRGNVAFPGRFVVGTGDFVRITTIHGTTNRQEGTSTTTREVVVRDLLRGDLLTETYVYNGNGYLRINWTARNYDDNGHLLSSHFANGLSTYSTWSDCCGKETDTDEGGSTIAYGHDALGRQISRTKLGAAISEGHSAQKDVVTTFDLDALGNIVRETQRSKGLELKTTTVYDLAGRLRLTVDSAGLTNGFVYGGGGRIATVVRPGGATEITENYPDGRIKSVTGTGVVPRFYDYGVNSDGSQWTTVHTGAKVSPLWEKTVFDMLGREVRSEKPGFGGTLVTATSEYNAKSQLLAVRQWTGNSPVTLIGAPTLYEYNEMGEQFRVALDMNTNGIIDLAGPDQIDETQTRIVEFENERWMETSTKVYASTTNAVPVTTSVQRSRISCLDGSCPMEETMSVDIRGIQTRTTKKVDPLKKTIITVRDVPDSEVNAVSTLYNGLLQTDTTPGGMTTKFVYDALGRTVATDDPRTGRAIVYYNGAGQVEYVRDAAGSLTRYAYDSLTGLRIRVTDASNNTIHTAYDLQGRATNVWGATYPVAYEYDTYGRMAAMKTWRDTNGAPDVTRWYYDEATGLLTNKLYADGTGPSYEYNAASRLTKRIWARGVAAEYAYNLLGQLTNINYSDSTPDVSFTYDRLGRQLTVTDALGTRTNVYDSATLDLKAERLPDGQILARSYDALGRPSGISLDGGYTASYSYDAAGRFAAIASAVLSATTVVNYAYLPKSDLLSGWTIRSGAATNPLVVVSRAYETKCDMISSIVNTSSVAFISRYDYVNDRLGRRVARNDATSGVVSVSNVFGYNARSELNSAAMGTNRFGYQYDPIGNRQSSFANTRTNQYEANVLNQYAQLWEGAAQATLQYDADGNLTNQGLVAYVWDAENRLVEVRTNGVLRMKNTYDYMGRRVQKETASSTNSFVYDDWNMVQEKWGTYTCSYLWGLDLSGTLQGAGGVGGLVAWTKRYVTGGSNLLSAAHVFVSDGNGNITDAINPTNHAKRVRFSYDPYGNLMTLLHPSMREIKFRFSSKYCDDETGLYYYGYRFYSPGLGRFLSRDPLGEDGGLNLGQFCFNNPINTIDILGQFANQLGGNPDVLWEHSIYYVPFGHPALKGHLGEQGTVLPILEWIPNGKITKTSPCCAKVERNSGAKLVTQVYIIDRNSIGNQVTARGWDEVHAHEYRRTKAVLMGTLSYISPVAGTGSAALRCGTICDEKGADVAIKKLQVYLENLRYSAWSQVYDYYWDEWGKIDNETWVMQGSLHHYHANIHQPSPPPPLKLPDCPSSSCSAAP